MPNAPYRHAGLAASPGPEPRRPSQWLRSAASVILRHGATLLIAGAMLYGALAYALGTWSVPSALERLTWPRIEARVDRIAGSVHRSGKNGWYSVYVTATPVSPEDGGSQEVVVLTNGESLRASAVKARLERTKRVTLLRSPDGRLIAPDEANVSGVLAGLAAGASVIGIALLLWALHGFGGELDFSLRFASRRPGDRLKHPGARAVGVLRDDSRAFALTSNPWSLGLRAAAFAGISGLALLMIFMVSVLVALVSSRFSEWSLTPSYRAFVALAALPLPTYVFVRAKLPDYQVITFDLERGVLRALSEGKEVVYTALAAIDAVIVDMDARGPAGISISWGTTKWKIFDRDAHRIEPRLLECVATRVREIVGLGPL